MPTRIPALFLTKIPTFFNQKEKTGFRAASGWVFVEPLNGGSTFAVTGSGQGRDVADHNTVGSIVREKITRLGGLKPAYESAESIVNKLLETDEVNPQHYVDNLEQFMGVEGDSPSTLDVYHIAPDGFQPNDDPEGFSVTPPPRGWTLLGTVACRSYTMNPRDHYREIMLPKDQQPPEAYRVIKFNGLKPAQVAKMFPNTFPSTDTAGRALMAKLKR